MCYRKTHPIAYFENIRLLALIVSIASIAKPLASSHPGQENLKNNVNMLILHIGSRGARKKSPPTLLFFETQTEGVY